MPNEVIVSNPITISGLRHPIFCQDIHMEFDDTEFDGASGKFNTEFDNTIVEIIDIIIILN